MVVLDEFKYQRDLGWLLFTGCLYSEVVVSTGLTVPLKLKKYRKDKKVTFQLGKYP